MTANTPTGALAAAMERRAIHLAHCDRCANDARCPQGDRLLDRISELSEAEEGA